MASKKGKKKNVNTNDTVKKQEKNSTENNNIKNNQKSKSGKNNSQVNKDNKSKINNQNQNQNNTRNKNDQKKDSGKSDVKINKNANQNNQKNQKNNNKKKNEATKTTKKKTFELEKKLEELQELDAKSSKKSKKPEQKPKKEEINKQSENKGKDKKQQTKTPKNKKAEKKNVNTDDNVKKQEPQIEEIKDNRVVYLAINIILVIFVVLVFSTTFALLNLGKNTYIKGIKIKDIDISNLTVEEANNKIKEALNIELMIDIDLKHDKEYEIGFQTSQIEYTYNIDKALDEAYKIGRSANIIENNYKILFTALVGKNFNVEYSYNKEALDYIIDDVSSKLPNLVIQPSHYIEEEQLIINKGTDGINVKKEELKQQILDYIKSRNAEKIILNITNQIIEIPVIETIADKIDIEKVHSEIYTEPKDAYYVENPFQIFVEINGIDFNITKEEAKKIIASEDKEEYIIPLKITRPGKTINDIGTEAFPYEISVFSTRYDARNYNRSGNLEIASDKINGTVLMPGDIFSFNKVVGKRTVEDGYRNAKIYANGQVVDGLAGGICQISSTLYNTVLLANLQIVERRNHSFKTSYLPTGKDATVVYGVTDFQFANSRQYPIKVEASVDSGVVEFKIHGIKEEVEYEVRILPVTTQYMPYTTQYVQDFSLPPGAHQVSQSGAPGSKVTTYKELVLNGAVISKELLSNDTYSPMNTIIRVGP